MKTLERLRLGALKVQDILLMLKNPENIHNSLPIIQGIVKVCISDTGIHCSVVTEQMERNLYEY